MTSRRVFVSYDHDGDMLEVLWGLREGYFTPTDDQRVLKRLDDEGEVIGFLIHEMSTFKAPSPVEFNLASEAPRQRCGQRHGARGGSPVGHIRAEGAATGPPGPRTGSDQGRSGVVDSYAGGADTREARSRGCRRSCCCGGRLVTGSRHVTGELGAVRVYFSGNRQTVVRKFVDEGKSARIADWPQVRKLTVTSVATRFCRRCATARLACGACVLRVVPLGMDVNPAARLTAGLSWAILTTDRIKMTHDPALGGGHVRGLRPVSSRA